MYATFDPPVGLRHRAANVQFSLKNRVNSNRKELQALDPSRSTPIVAQQIPGMHIPRRGRRVRMLSCVRVHVNARARQCPFNAPV